MKPFHKVNTLKTTILILVLIIFWNRSDADELLIDGDLKTLINAESQYHVTLVRENIFRFVYKFIFDMSPNVVHWEQMQNEKQLLFNWNFTGIKPGIYPLNIQAYVYPFFNAIYGWKVAEINVPIEISDCLDDFVLIDAQQDLQSTDNVFVNNKTVNFTTKIDPRSILRRKLTKLDFDWSIDGPNLNHTEFKGANFSFVFQSIGAYQINLNTSAIIPPNQLEAWGKTSSELQIKAPISKVNITGNNFVENGSLLHLLITCDGSSQFIICHFFSNNKSNDSCFDSGKVLTNCAYQITHYFSQNGTKYVNIGIRNDVSTVYRNYKITIYKVGPKPSFVFVIIPLISLMLVIAITVVCITHFIRQRRKMNATIEEATVQNFGIYDHDDDEALDEKTFCLRVKDSLREAFYGR